MDDAVDSFIQTPGLIDDGPYIKRGALLAQDRRAFERARSRLQLRDDKWERDYLTLEKSLKRKDRFNQTWTLYALVIVCSLGAAVQGWDESAVSGAQVFYKKEFPELDQDANLLGLVNSAPYLCCAFACWMNYPLNKWFGRRGTIFITCIISSVTCLGQGFSQNWKQLFVTRFLLGFGIGPKSATVPIFAAECAPANVRGALVMMWQMWIAFGIMCGYIAGVVLYHAIDEDVSWRYMLASPMILPIVVIAYVYCLPESPRWLLQKAQKEVEDERKRQKYYERAWSSLCTLRHTKLQAARDLFLIHHLLKNEREVLKQQSPLVELFTNGRNRRALTASVIVMFLQQFCGVNVLVYYSTYVLTLGQDPAFKIDKALLAGMGFGIINFVFAFPAVWTIDNFGRRNLLLLTFPFMAVFQGFIAIALGLAKGATSNALLLVGMYLFAVAYSPGECPVPFVYAAESMPLYNRDYGMGIVTAILWLFNFVLAFTTPKLVEDDAFRPWGTFLWYGAWCIIGWWAILLFVPETKELHLEQLNKVFQKSTSAYIAHGFEEMGYFVRRFLFGDRDCRRPTLLGTDDVEFEFGRPGPEEDDRVGGRPPMEMFEVANDRRGSYERGEV